MYHFGDDGRNGGRGEPPAQAMLRGVDNAIVTLNAGFTTIQSPGQAVDKELRDAIARGIIPGPRILTSLQPLMENSGTAGETPRAGSPAKAAGRRLHQAVRLQEHPRRAALKP